ncbi:hypothetical protein AB6A40_011779 [Gnathostoma spinigerum]|uniref:Uncharacterized protein n=1 Tax=Gnathostoma spinigerum TaxID=75299 RepID=A0ABD6EYN5_9BILA
MRVVNKSGNVFDDQRTTISLSNKGPVIDCNPGIGVTNRDWSRKDLAGPHLSSISNIVVPSGTRIFAAAVAETNRDILPASNTNIECPAVAE